MIELGDVLQGKRGERFVGLVTEADLEEVRVAKFDRLYNNYQGSEQFEQGFIRARIRDGVFHKNGHADELSEAVATRQMESESGEFSGSTAYKFDSTGTESVYRHLKAGENPKALDSNAVLFDAHSSQWRTVVEAGWRSDGLADDLLRMGDDSIESVSTVVQAMREGLWLLMTANNATVADNPNVNIDGEIDPETGNILE